MWWWVSSVVWRCSWWSSLGWGFWAGFSLFVLFTLIRAQQKRRRYQITRSLGAALHFGLDIGGTLTKLAYFVPLQNKHASKKDEEQRRIQSFLEKTTREEEFTCYCGQLGGTMYFTKFQSDRITELAKVVVENQLASRHSQICVTGGGAVKHRTLIQATLGIEFEAADEFASLVHGIDFMRHVDPGEVYFLKTFDFKQPVQKELFSELHYPYLVVNIGSGVSVLVVKGHGEFERVGGSAIGGGTFLGLCQALSGSTSFDEALLLASQGHANNVNLLVGDIYGGDYDQFNLSEDTVASNFGKLGRASSMKDVSRGDLARAALVMITANIGSLANLYAHRVLHVPRIVFCGNFLTSKNEIAARMLSHACHFWSKGTAQALFLKHEGYLGAIGSLLLTASKIKKR